MRVAGRPAWLVPLLVLAFFSVSCEKPRVVQVPVGQESTEAVFWRGEKNQSPAVILIPPAGGSKEAWLPLAEKFQKAGFSVLALDLRGDGRTGPESVLEDVRAGFSYLRAMDRVDAARIGLIGVAAGADAALSFAAEEPMVQFAALASPALPYPDFELAEVAHEYGFRPLFVGELEGDASSRDAVRRLSENIRGDTVVKSYSGSAETKSFLSAKGPFGRDLLAFLKVRL